MVPRCRRGPSVKNQAKEALLQRLITIAEQARTEPLNCFERGMSWQGVGTVFTLPESAAYEFLDLISKLVQDHPWSKKFSEDYLQQRLVPILKSAQMNGAESAAPLLEQLVEVVETYSTERVVYVPVQGLVLSIDELAIGQIVLRTMEGEPFDRLMGLVGSTITESDGGAQNDELLAYRQSRITEKLRGKVCAEFRTVAEPIRARELAEQETRRALELLTFANVALFPFHKQADTVMGLDGEHPTLMAWVAVTSATSFEDFTRRAPTSWTLPITASILERFEQVGVLVLSDLLALPDSQLTDLDRALLRAVHWFAAAQAQTEIENRLLNLITCLEALLGPKDGSPISSSIAEATALIVTQGYENRLRIKRAIIALYQSRSGISHGGKKSVSEAKIVELRAICANILTILISWRGRLKSRDDLLNWLEHERLSGESSEPPHPSDEAKPLRQLREKRSWTHDYLANRSGIDVRQIEYWEQSESRPDLGSLRRLADAFDLHPEDIAVRPVDRWVIVREHRFLLTARRQQAGNWVARVEGWDFSNAVEWPRRAVDPAYPDINSPTILLRDHWRNRGVTTDRALTELADRIMTTMERALSSQQVPGDPPDWQPLDVPEHWRQHVEGRLRRQERSGSDRSVEENLG